MPRLLSPKTPDPISSVYLLGLIFVVLAAQERITDWRWLPARNALLMDSQMAVAAGRGRGLPRILAAFFPLVPVLVICDSLRFIPKLNPGDRDDLLIRIDRTVLGGDPSLWHERISTPWLTELLQLAYLVYYVFPSCCSGPSTSSNLAWRRNPDRPANTGGLRPVPRGSSPVPTTSPSWATAIPALGPRFALAPTYRTDLTGLLVAEPTRHLLDAPEGIKRDTFPSGYTPAVGPEAVPLGVSPVARLPPDASEGSAGVPGESLGPSEGAAGRIEIW